MANQRVLKVKDLAAGTQTSAMNFTHWESIADPVNSIPYDIFAGDQDFLFDINTNIRYDMYYIYIRFKGVNFAGLAPEVNVHRGADPNAVIAQMPIIANSLIPAAAGISVVDFKIANAGAVFYGLSFVKKNAGLGSIIDKIWIVGKSKH